MRTKATYPARPSVEHHLANPQDGNRIRHHLAGAMFLPFDPSAQTSWLASKRARVSRQDLLPRRRRSYQDAGIVLLFPKNFSGEGRWITARHKHSDFPLDMFDAFFKRPRRFFVNAQRGSTSTRQFAE